MLETAHPSATPASPAPLHAERLTADIKARLHARRRPAFVALRLAADYAPDLAARYRLVVEGPPEPFRPAPVKATVARFDLGAPIRFPALIAGRLAMIRAAETASQLRTAEVVER